MRAYAVCLAGVRGAPWWAAASVTGVSEPTDASAPDELPDEVARLLALGRAARGFLPDDEGLALLRHARARAPHGPLLEVGTWCGKSAVHLGAAVREARRHGIRDAVAFTLDHHRGSEENQPGWEWHDETLVDPRVGRIDTLPHARATLTDAGLEDEVVMLVGRAPLVAAHWRTPLSLLFIDGGHTDEHVSADYDGFGPWVMPGGTLVFHDIFERPEDGGQAPWRCWRRAMDSGLWDEIEVVGSLHALRRRPLTSASRA